VQEQNNLNLIDALEWRYACKQFDSSKKVSSKDIEYLKRTVQLAASSYGLQAYRILIIEDPIIKRKLVKASYNQGQVEECSHLFVFCNFVNISPKDIDYFIALNSNITGKSMKALEGFQNHLNGAMKSKSQEAMKLYTNKQCYIALANLLIACGTLQIDACPMEGIIPASYNEILNLDKQGLNASLACPVGYRHPDDKYQYIKKVRKPKDNLFKHI
tara:strand:+ start:2868 stop:3515 length:648 start_codon:yes stop_codon:yes gene_type:complete